MTTTRTWVAPPAGPRISYAWNNPHNWSPEGVPQAGDNLIMVTGIMDVTHAKLPAELHLGPGPSQLAVDRTILNMVGSSATVGGTLLNYSGLTDGGAAPLTFFASGTDHLTADNLSAVEGTLNVAANSDLVVTGKMTFGYAGHLEGAGTVTNNGIIGIADGDISTHVNGHGILEMHQYHDRVGVQTISGAIDKGQTVELVFNNQDTRTELVHPETFKAKLEIAPGDFVLQSGKTATLLLDGIHASEMDIRGDLLQLSLERGPPLWQVHEHMPAGMTASMTNTAAGTEIVFTPHPLVG